MKVIEKEKVIKEVVGYEANDGKRFTTEQECKLYEESAYGVIQYEFKKLIEGGDTFAECDIFKNQGYGSEEYQMAVVNIKNADDLKIVNQYLQMRQNKLLSPDVIGKKVLICVGFEFERIQGINTTPRTEEELIEQFKKDIHCFFDGSYFKK